MLLIPKDYSLVARKNEEIFKSILRDLQKNREKIPLGEYIPEHLETELPFAEILEKYSKSKKFPSLPSRFIITNFIRPKKSKAIIEFQNHSLLSGGGAELEYKIKKDNVVEYKKLLSYSIS